MFADQPVVFAQVVVPVEALFALTAGDPLNHDDPIPDTHVANLTPRFLNETGRVHTGDHGERESYPREPPPYPEVEMVDGRRFHPHKNIIWPDSRSWDVLEDQLINPPMFMNSDALHSDRLVVQSTWR
jgi:hypothetical protein